MNTYGMTYMKTQRSSLSSVQTIQKTHIGSAVSVSKPGGLWGLVIHSNIIPGGNFMLQESSWGLEETIYGASWLHKSGSLSSEFPQGELMFAPYTVVMTVFGAYCLIIPIST